MAYRTTAKAISELRHPWASLVGEIPSLTRQLEEEFRFGQRVTFFNGSYRKGGNIKGGSSSIWYPAEEEEYEAYEAWRVRDGIPSEEDREAYERLVGLLERGRVRLTGSGSGDPKPYQPRHGAVYRLTLEVLNALPWDHVSGKEVAAIQLGGWGPDSAKGSAYEGAAVLMYDFAIKGARRTFVGLLLHELGHAHEKRIQGEGRERIREAYPVLMKEDALIGVDYLLDGESRKAYQRTSLNEFLAETYMIYVSHGGALRRGMEGTGGDASQAWRQVYSVFREGFGGVEYA